MIRAPLPSGLSPAVTRWFSDLSETGVLAPVDGALAEMMLRLSDPRTESGRQVLALSSAIVSASSREGETLLDLGPSARSPFFDTLPEGAPPPSSWREILEEVPSLVGGPDRPAPLVLDGDSLYLFRYYQSETRVAASLAGRLLSGPLPSAPVPSPEEAEKVLDHLFLDSSGPSGNGRLAALHSLSCSLLVLTGGPGTGKTWTASRVIALHRILFPDLRIVASAPTGKAAARLGQALGESGMIGTPPPSMTLHRLLEAGASGFSRHRKNPLDWDLVLVDELSMVDLPLMDKLLQALPDRSKLVLTGDRNQLVSVGAGSVMSDLSSSLSELPDGSPAKGALHVLTHNVRQSESRNIRDFTRAVALGEARQALEVLEGGTETGRTAEIEWILPGSGSDKGIPPPTLERIADLWAPLCDATSAGEAPFRAAPFMVLSALREGPWGTREINRRIHGQMRRRVPVDRLHAPVMILENSYETGLMNGDLGREFRELLSFPRGESVLEVSRRLAPEWDYAYAMTVHKSQGSEFDHVFLAFGSADHPLLTRALLYTAATRARRRLTVWASREVLEKMILRKTERSSALGERLSALISGSP